MVSCVALVEVQLSVEELPLLMEVGSAESVTVGCGLGCSTGAGCGVVATGFFLHPTVKTVASKPATNKARYNGRETSLIRILLRRTWITRVRPTESNIVTLAGWFRRYLVSRYILNACWSRRISVPRAIRVRKSNANSRDNSPHQNASVYAMQNSPKMAQCFYFGDQLGDSLWPLMVS